MRSSRGDSAASRNHNLGEAWHGTLHRGSIEWVTRPLQGHTYAPNVPISSWVLLELRDVSQNGNEINIMLKSNPHLCTLALDGTCTALIYMGPSPDVGKMRRMINGFSSKGRRYKASTLVKKRQLDLLEKMTNYCMDESACRR